VPGNISPTAIGSTSSVNGPAVAQSTPGTAAPSTIASGAIVGAPAITAPASINNTQGDANLTGNDVAGFASRAQALDTRLTSMGY
jgi:hypothetical protein